MVLETLVPTLLWGALGIVYWYTFKFANWLDSKSSLKSSSFKDFCVYGFGALQCQQLVQPLWSFGKRHFRKITEEVEMMRYKTKFNLLRDEVVKANNELVDNKVFETYVAEGQQGTIMITNAIVKALVKTVKFYEQENIEAKEQVEGEQVWSKDAEQTCNRVASYITKLECKNEELKNELEEAQEKLESLRKENKGWESYIKELKEQNECYKTDNKNLIETA